MNAKLKEMRMPPSKPKVNQIQRKYLEDRLHGASRVKEFPDGVRPPEVVAAERQIKSLDQKVEAWRGKQRKAERAFDERVRQAKATVRERILFGTPEEALAAVEAFEKQSFA